MIVVFLGFLYLGSFLVFLKFSIFIFKIIYIGGWGDNLVIGILG